MSNAPRKPWPMKWIVLAIVVCIVPYTWITLHYRKEQPAFRPYEDMKNRANVTRLLAAGYQRIPLQADRPADTGRAPGGATVSTAAGGVPAGLRTTLVDDLLLPAQIVSVTAAPSVAASQPYAVQFVCELPSDRQQLGGADLYVRGTELVLAPTFERIAGGLTIRSRQAAVLLTVPGGALKPGHYTVTLLAERASRAWGLDVK